MMGIEEIDKITEYSLSDIAETNNINSDGSNETLALGHKGLAINIEQTANLSLKVYLSHTCRGVVSPQRTEGISWYLAMSLMCCTVKYTQVVQKSHMIILPEKLSTCSWNV